MGKENERVLYEETPEEIVEEIEGLKGEVERFKVELMYVNEENKKLKHEEEVILQELREAHAQIHHMKMAQKEEEKLKGITAFLKKE